MFNKQDFNPLLFNSDYVVDKFIDYQNFYPPAHCYLIKSYIDTKRLSEVEQIKLLLMLCYAYSDVWAIRLYEKYLKEFDMKKLISTTPFSSARTKFKTVTKFEPFIKYIHSVDWVEWYKKHKDIDSWEKLQDEILKIPQIWVFSSDLFVEYVENLEYLGQNNLFKNMKPRKTEKDWSKWANETMCISLLYWDIDWFNKLQGEYRANGWYNLSNKEIDMLETMKERLVHGISQRYWKKPWWIFKGKLCSFKNLYEWKRYAWFHFWRQSEQIKKQEIYDKKFSEMLQNIRMKTYKPYQLQETHIDRSRMRVRIEKALLWVEIDWVLY